MLAAMATMEKGSIILLHACAHNPTGVDPTPEQWSAIIDACKKQGLIPMIDSAYQGYASGDLAKDGDSVKQFLDSGMEFLVTQSFAKNFGLYGERIGYLHIVAGSKDRADAVLSQIKLVIRPMYSSPPRHGAFLVNRILTSPERKAMWIKDLQKMSTRIVEMRSVLRSALEEKGTPGTWNHITDQIGMFSYTGLTEAQCARLTQEYHIYLLKSGRISMAGINEGNVQYVADAIYTVVSES
jgi:aspartate aminotransferase